MAGLKVKSGKYLVLLEGKNFLIEAEGERARKYGFFASAAVEGTGENDARQRAVALIRSDAALQSLVNNKPKDRPSLVLFEVEKLRSFRTHRQGLSPLVWYKEEKRNQVKKMKPSQR